MNASGGVLHTYRWLLCVLGLTALSCGGSGSQPIDDLNSPQTPPRGAAAIGPWIELGFYRSWKCELAPHPARPFGAHGDNRVCSNDLLSAAGPGEFPVGAASVKEIYSGTNVVGFAVSRHTTAGMSGSTRYWYERIGEGGGATDAQGARVCVGCHSQAGNNRPGHDYVYTQVR